MSGASYGPRNTVASKTQHLFSVLVTREKGLVNVRDITQGGDSDMENSQTKT